MVKFRQFVSRRDRLEEIFDDIKYYKRYAADVLRVPINNIQISFDFSTCFWSMSMAIVDDEDLEDTGLEPEELEVEEIKGKEVG